MINLFSEDSVGGIVYHNMELLGLENDEFIVICLRLYAGDIRTPFSVSSRREVYGAYFEELISMVSSSIRRLKKTLKRDNHVCIWYSKDSLEEYLAMLAFIEWLTENGAVIYLSDYTEVCPEMQTNSECEFIKKPDIHPLTNEERSTYLAVLSRLKMENTKLRMFKDGRIVSLPEESFDERILEIIGDREMKTIMVYPEINDELPLMLTFVLYRIRKLIAKGELEIVKHGKIDSGAIYGTGDDFGKTIVRRKK